MSLLEMNGICKSFNGIQVLKEVSLRVEAGEVHALWERMELENLRL